MKKFIIIGLLILLGCTVNEPYVKVSQRGLCQTAIISTIKITDDAARIKFGAGVFISKYGHILTASHIFPDVVDEGSITVTTYLDHIYGGELLSRDLKNDLALIKINEYIPNPAKIARPGNLQVGQEVIAIGHPYGFDWTVTNGIISNLNVDRFQYNMLQTNAAINPGNSGGPLFNLKGEVVGINTKIFSLIRPPVNTGLGFAVSNDQLWIFLTKFKGVIK